MAAWTAFLARLRRALRVRCQPGSGWSGSVFTAPNPGGKECLTGIRAQRCPSLQIRWVTGDSRQDNNGIDTAPPALHLTTHLQTDFNLEAKPYELKHLYVVVVAVVVVVAAVVVFVWAPF